MPEFLRRGDELEAGLPHALRLIGAELDCGIPFDEALGGAAGEGTPFGRALLRVLAESRTAGMPGALARLAARAEPLAVKRAAVALSRAYARGGSGEQLKALAAGLARGERIAMRQYAARLSAIGIAFTAASCVLPSLFLSLAVVGQPVFGELASPELVWFAFCVALPLVLLALAAAAWLAVPPSLRLRRSAFLSREQRARVGRLYCGRFGGTFPFPTLFAASSLAAALMPAAFGASVPSVAAASFVLLSPLTAFSVLAWRADAAASEAERRMPDALLHAAAQLSCDSFEGALESVRGPAYGGFGATVSAALARTRAGEALPAALRAAGGRSGSRPVSRALALLARAAETGADAADALRETAEDAAEAAAAAKETAAIVAPQRYALLAGVLLVPGILGALARAASGMPAGGIVQAGLGDGAGALGETVAAAEAFLALFSALAALFLSIQEGETAKAAAYAPLLLPLALGVFLVSSGSAGR